jgi:transcription elongation GreA/GreB family factor
MTLKQKIYDHYCQVMQEKIILLQSVLADLKETGSNETKSTAGDKHETALAMIQIEQEHTRVQLKEAIAQKTILDKIDPAITVSTIINGSLIKTNRGYLFMSIALGKATIDGYTVIALSPQSPLGQKLMSLGTGDAVEVNGNQYYIESVE